MRLGNEYPFDSVRKVCYEMIRIDVTRVMSYVRLFLFVYADGRAREGVYEGEAGIAAKYEISCYSPDGHFIG